MKETNSLKINGYVFVAVVLLSFLASILNSKLYWGYFFYRPEIFKEFNEIDTVNALIPIITEPNENGSRNVKYYNDFSIENKIEYCQRDSYYCLYGRVLLALKKQRLLPSNPSGSLEHLPNIYKLIKNTGILTQPDQGYINSDLFRGLIVDAANKSGERTVFISISGRELSNDHYPYYEMLFIEDQETNILKFTKGQKFYYDVAGIEGAEWYLLWPFLFVIGSIPGIIISTIIAVCKKRKQNKLLPNQALKSDKKQRGESVYPSNR